MGGGGGDFKWLGYSSCIGAGVRNKEDEDGVVVVAVSGLILASVVREGVVNSFVLVLVLEGAV